jgi:FMN-dependent NADH-azoreductase
LTQHFDQLTQHAFLQRGPKSWTRLLLSKFTQAFLASHPSHRVVTREVQSIPHLDFEALEAGRTDQKLHTPEQQRAFALANELTDELVNADAIIISTPMYNWSLPSALKAWVDRVVNCRTFYQRTDTTAKIPVTFIVVSGVRTFSRI